MWSPATPCWCARASACPWTGLCSPGSGGVDESMLTGESLPVARPRATAWRRARSTARARSPSGRTRPARTPWLSRIVDMVAAGAGLQGAHRQPGRPPSAVFVPTSRASPWSPAWPGCWPVRAGPSPSRSSRRSWSSPAPAPWAWPRPCPSWWPPRARRAAGRAGQKRRGPAGRHRAGVVVFDKTGTLTHRQAGAAELAVAPGCSHVRGGSHHPGRRGGEPLRASAGQACCNAASERGLAATAPEAFTAQPGQGIKCHGGRPRGAHRQRALRGDGLRHRRAWRNRGAHGRPGGPPPCCMEVERAARAILGEADQLRPRRRNVSRHGSGRLGLRLIMLTGDNQRTAQAIAARSGVSEVVWPGCCPTARCPGRSRAEGRRAGTGRAVVMVGDGINDAPALPGPTWARPWARASTRPWRASTWCCCPRHRRRAHGAAPIARGHGQHSVRICSGPSPSTPSHSVAAGRAARLWRSDPEPHARRHGHGPSSVTVVSNALRLRFFTPKH